MKSGAIVSIVVVVVVVLVGVLYFTGALTPGPSAPLGGEPNFVSRTYSNSMSGLSFSYPSRYYLVEREVGNAERRHYQILLVDDTPQNRDLIAGKIPGTEGPIAVTVDIYQNNLDKMTTEEWVTGTNDSNYKLGSGATTSVNIGGLQGLSYTWDGLYQGQTVAVANSKNVYAFSATYNSLEDHTIKDLPLILTTVKIQ